MWNRLTAPRPARHDCTVGTIDDARVLETLEEIQRKFAVLVESQKLLLRSYARTDAELAVQLDAAESSYNTLSAALQRPPTSPAAPSAGQPDPHAG